MALGRKAKVSARIARLFEPVGVINASGKGRGSLYTGAGNAHQDLARRR